MRKKYTIQNNSNRDTAQGFIYDYDQTIIENIINKRQAKKEIAKWASYLLTQNITEIKYYPGGMDGKNNCQPAITLTKDQLTKILTKILTKMTTSSLTKTNMAGLGGLCMSNISIKYNNKELYIHANQTIDASNTDGEILSSLEKENYIPDVYDYADNNWYYIYNWDTSYINTIIK